MKFNYINFDVNNTSHVVIYRESVTEKGTNASMEAQIELSLLKNYCKQCGYSLVKSNNPIVNPKTR